MAGLGATLLASLAMSGLATAATTWFVTQIGLEAVPSHAGSPPRWRWRSHWPSTSSSSLYLFTRLPQLSTPLRRVAKGALLGAVGLEILKVVATWLVGRTTRNPVYGAFAVIIGLLIWINLVSRFTLFVAAWTVSAPFDTDVPLSGTSLAETAEQASIPPAYADHDPDDVPTTVGDGAPAPFAAAMQGRTPPRPGRRPRGPARRATEKKRHRHTGRLARSLLERVLNLG